MRVLSVISFVRPAVPAYHATRYQFDTMQSLALELECFHLRGVGGKSAAFCAHKLHDRLILFWFMQDTLAAYRSSHVYLRTRHLTGVVNKPRKVDVLITL